MCQRADSDTSVGTISFIEGCKQNQYIIHKQCQNPHKGQAMYKQHKLWHSRARYENQKWDQRDNQ